VRIPIRINLHRHLGFSLELVERSGFWLQCNLLLLSLSVSFFSDFIARFAGSFSG
jgi:hypothetical protein